MDKMDKMTEMNKMTEMTEMTEIDKMDEMNEMDEILYTSIMNMDYDNEHIVNMGSDANIEKCNNLNIDIIEINLVAANIFGVLDLSRFKNCKKLNCYFNKITALILPPNVEYVNCSYNLISVLKLTKNINTLICNNNKLTELHLSKKLTKLNCSNNNLTKLILSPNLINLTCTNNPFIYNFNPTELTITNINSYNQQNNII
jgi:hypothetical protein